MSEPSVVKARLANDDVWVVPFSGTLSNLQALLHDPEKFISDPDIRFDSFKPITLSFSFVLGKDEDGKTETHVAEGVIGTNHITIFCPKIKHIDERADVDAELDDYLQFDKENDTSIIAQWLDTPKIAYTHYDPRVRDKNDEESILRNTAQLLQRPELFPAFLNRRRVDNKFVTNRLDSSSESGIATSRAKDNINMIFQLSNDSTSAKTTGSSYRFVYHTKPKFIFIDWDIINKTLYNICILTENAFETYLCGSLRNDEQQIEENRNCFDYLLTFERLSAQRPDIEDPSKKNEYKISKDEKILRHIQQITSDLVYMRDIIFRASKFARNQQAASSEYMLKHLAECYQKICQLAFQLPTITSILSTQLSNYNQISSFYTKCFLLLQYVYKAEKYLKTAIISSDTNYLTEKRLFNLMGDSSSILQDNSLSIIEPLAPFFPIPHIPNESMHISDLGAAINTDGLYAVIEDRVNNSISAANVTQLFSESLHILVEYIKYFEEQLSLHAPFGILSSSELGYSVAFTRPQKGDAEHNQFFSTEIAKLVKNDELKSFVIGGNNFCMKSAGSYTFDNNGALITVTITETTQFRWSGILLTDI
jgi:hypothetical protein